tara:strand:- start:386 stop:637 length:252 start_codon:yes stop_codon:yes gene_type:complete
MSLGWQQRAEKTLLGKKITAVRWMTDEEAKDLAWDDRPLCIELDHKIWIFASMDDEGNNAGALFTTDKDESGFPVMSVGDEVK